MSIFFQVWIDVLHGRAYATRYDKSGDPDRDKALFDALDRRYPPHPCEFRVETDDPEFAIQQAWIGFSGMRAVSGIVRAIVRDWAWSSSWAKKYLIHTGIVEGPPGQYNPPYPLFKI